MRGVATRARDVIRVCDRHPTAIVFGLGLALRLVAVVWLGDAAYDQGGDAPYYLAIARDILEGRPYGSSVRDTTRVPLYHIFLAAHLWIFGQELRTIAITQALIGAATAVVLTWTAQELRPGTRRWLIGVLWATYPPAILNVVVIFPQTLQLFWLVGAFWLLVAGLRRGSMWRCAAAAGCWGAACMTRSSHLLFLPVFSAAPVMCWRLAGACRWRWRIAAAVVMFSAGALSVVWWTGREFTTTYRLEYLLLNIDERTALGVVLGPFEPLHARLTARLRAWGNGPGSGQVDVSPTRSRTPAPGASPAIMPDPVQAVPAGPSPQLGRAVRWMRQISRGGIKLRQAFSAPDGMVQLRCTGPPGGYWATFRAEFASSPLRIAGMAFSQGCLGLKSLMYVQHYVLLALVFPGLVFLACRLPGFALLLVLFAVYSMAAIVLVSDYRQGELAAVPRFAFVLTPLVILVTGVVALEAVGSLGAASSVRRHRG